MDYVLTDIDECSRNTDNCNETSTIAKISKEDTSVPARVASNTNRETHTIVTVSTISVMVLLD